MNSNFFVSYVKSFERKAGTASDFSFVLNVPTQHNFDSVSMIQASIPKSYYIIDEGRNQLVLREGGVDITITLPVGNYSRRVFAKVLQALLTANSPNGYVYGIGVPNAGIGPDNGKFQFMVTNSGPAPTVSPIQFILPQTSSPCLQMGFPIGATVTFIGGLLESQNITVFQATSMLYISCDLVDNNGTTILQDINSTTPDFTELVFQVGDAGGIFTNVKKLRGTWSNTIRMTLRNIYGEVVNLNGLEWACSLLFWNSKAGSTYEEPKYHDVEDFQSAYDESY